MIWYNEAVRCNSDDNLILRGLYNELCDDNNVIEIILIVPALDSDCSNNDIILFAHNPSYMIAPDDYIDPEMIKNKYYSKIVKIKSIISKLTLDQILVKYNSK